MAKVSAIAWTKSTFNPWIGCTKVGPGCDGCYAEALDRRIKYGGATHWGAGVPRHRTKERYWREPLEWNAKAPGTEFAGRKGFWPVFCASLADVFDNEVPDAWRFDLWTLIEWTQSLTWFIVTKRVGNVKAMVPSEWYTDRFPPNVRIIATIVNQEEADRDIPKLLALPCLNGISYEPALGPVDWDEYVCSPMSMDGWMIVGGESNQAGHKARPFNLFWARSTLRQCAAMKIPVFVKQLGSNPIAAAPYSDWKKGHSKAGADPGEWPAEIRVQQFP
jgi:protein gp37